MISNDENGALLLKWIHPCKYRYFSSVTIKDPLLLIIYFNGALALKRRFTHTLLKIAPIHLVLNQTTPYPLSVHFI